MEAFFSFQPKTVTSYYDQYFEDIQGPGSSFVIAGMRYEEQLINQSINQSFIINLNKYFTHITCQPAVS